MPYSVPGSMPAGQYFVSVIGSPGMLGAKIHFDLLYHQMAFASVDLTPGSGGIDGGVPGSTTVVMTAPGVASACGDSIVLHMQLVSARSSYNEVMVGLTTP